MLDPSKKLVYAVESVVDIAYNGGSEPVRSREIAKRQGVPHRYLEQVMQRLVHAGVLRGVRGPRGGYRLARERRRVTVGEIARVVYEINGDGSGFEYPTESRLGQEVVHPLWRDLQGELLEKLDTITIEDLCRKADERGVESEARERLNYMI